MSDRAHRTLSWILTIAVAVLTVLFPVLLIAAWLGAPLPEYSVQSVGAAMIAAMKFGFDAVKSKSRKR